MMRDVEFGSAWIRRFDNLTERGVPAREVAIAMAAEMDRLMGLAVRRAELQPGPTIFVVQKCPHCGKAIGPAT